MKRRTGEVIRLDAQLGVAKFLACYGLRDALRVHAEMGRMLRAEKARRGKIEGRRGMA